MHPGARRDLSHIAAGIAAHVGWSAARRKIEEIAAVIASLGNVPHRGTIRDDTGLRAVPAGRRGVVVFRVGEPSRTVEVIAVSYGGSDWTKAAGRRNRHP
ncbi:MAG: type II toxin-antitoxin system RelE/ParE family toxin [Amaricoccus sp.]|uniref:type II toxin-antitoxin system RelE/ParE family toxin n=1 Tax=Amaricoccus sp. TaxID=1872485 RepID=UPI0039E6A8D8